MHGMTDLAAKRGGTIAKVLRQYTALRLRDEMARWVVAAAISKLQNVRRISCVMHFWRLHARPKTALFALSPSSQISPLSEELHVTQWREC